jgi:hypothetical protein
MREQLEEEGRILDSDWAHYTMSNVLFQPKQMTAAQLTVGQIDTYRRFYSIPSILKRCLDLRGRTLRRLVVNLGYRGIIRGNGVSRATGVLWRRPHSGKHIPASSAR